MDIPAQKNKDYKPIFEEYQYQYKLIEHGKKTDVITIRFMFDSQDNKQTTDNTAVNAPIEAVSDTIEAVSDTVAAELDITMVEPDDVAARPDDVAAKPDNVAVKPDNVSAEPVTPPSKPKYGPVQTVNMMSYVIVDDIIRNYGCDIIGSDDGSSNGTIIIYICYKYKVRSAYFTDYLNSNGFKIYKDKSQSYGEDIAIIWVINSFNCSYRPCKFVHYNKGDVLPFIKNTNVIPYILKNEAISSFYTFMGHDTTSKCIELYYTYSRDKLSTIGNFLNDVGLKWNTYVSPLNKHVHYLVVYVPADYKPVWNLRFPAAIEAAPIKEGDYVNGKKYIVAKLIDVDNKVEFANYIIDQIAKMKSSSDIKEYITKIQKDFPSVDINEVYNTIFAEYKNIQALGHKPISYLIEMFINDKNIDETIKLGCTIYNEYLSTLTCHRKYVAISTEEKDFYKRAIANWIIFGVKKLTQYGIFRSIMTNEDFYIDFVEYIPFEIIGILLKDLVIHDIDLFRAVLVRYKNSYWPRIDFIVNPIYGYLETDHFIDYAKAIKEILDPRNNPSLTDFDFDIDLYEPDRLKCLSRACICDNELSLDALQKKARSFY